MSLEDVDSRTLVMNDSTLGRRIEDKGKISVEYSCRIPALINDRTIKIYASVLTDNNAKLAYTLDEESPAFLVRRNDLQGPADEQSKKALLRRTGVWEVL
jgi:hypothetical protein